MFLSASDDKSGALDVIEEKIARATMLPRTYGEVLFSVQFRAYYHHHLSLYKIIMPSHVSF